MDKNLSFLSEKQKTAYLLRKQGKKFKEISAEMNVSYATAREHYLLAEKRISEYKHFDEVQKKNNIPLSIDINLIELKYIMRALLELVSYWDSNSTYNIKSNRLRKYPNEYEIVKNLFERLQIIHQNVVDKKPVPEMDTKPEIYPDFEIITD